MDSLSKLLGAIAALVAIITGVVAAVPPFKRWLLRRPIATAALIGLATSLTTTRAVLSIVGVAKVVADPLRIEAGGPEQPGVDTPFVDENDADRAHPPVQAVLQSEGKQVCALSDVRTLSEAPTAFKTGEVSGSCELHKENGVWGIAVRKGMQCKVTCFRLKLHW